MPSRGTRRRFEGQRGHEQPLWPSEHLGGGAVGKGGPLPFCFFNGGAGGAPQPGTFTSLAPLR